ncbi:hypothetical protein CUN67_13060 [Pantoea cypripedii]|uniref:DUF551 domain-containing protein n=2 Tax=Pantoea cypripedii TaxID=55209 RepID=A0A6B9G2X9_PANCY|nr:hypothetical protein CUN67_13060 [Pantoea cypripedii]
MQRQLMDRVAAVFDGNHIPDAGKMTGWVKCSDRLPDKSGDYLVLCHYPNFHERCFVQHVMNFLHTAYETPVMRWYDRQRADYITHWQLLPEVPDDK